LTGRDRAQRGRPAEAVLTAYLLFSAASTAILQPAEWAWLLAAHLMAIGLLVVASRRLPSHGPRAWRCVRTLLPLLTYPLLYHVTGRLNVALSAWVLDAPIERLESVLFGGQPSLYLAELLPWRSLSETLHLCYFSYYVLVVLLPVVLTLQQRHAEASHTVFVLCLTFAICLVFYVWLPVRSPYYAYPPLQPTFSEGMLYRTAHYFSAQGGVVGGAFPSSHAALATVNLLLAYRYLRRAFWWTLLPTAGLLFATVYARYHYAIDTFAGVGLAFGVVVALGRGCVTGNGECAVTRQTNRSDELR